MKVPHAQVHFANGRLSVKGTKGDDDIQLQRLDDKTVKVTVNGEEKTYTGVKSVRVNGGKGNDTIGAFADQYDGKGCGNFESYASGNKHMKVRIAGGKGDDEISSNLDYAKLLGGH